MPKNKIYVEYNPVGEIRCVFEGHIQPIPISGNKIITSDFTIEPDEYYVENAHLVKKKKFPELVVNVQGFFSAKLPVGTRAKWLGEWYEIDDGCLDIEIDQEGVFKLTLRHLFYANKEVEIVNKKTR